MKDSAPQSTGKIKPSYAKSVDAYLSNFRGETLARLAVMRRMIFDILPTVEESMAYGMPAYKRHGKPLVYFAGYENHIGFYATPNGHEAFKAEFAKYKQGKGSVQFPHDKPLPLELVKRVVKFRVEHVIK